MKNNKSTEAQMERRRAEMNAQPQPVILNTYEAIMSNYRKAVKNSCGEQATEFFKTGVNSAMIVNK